MLLERSAARSLRQIARGPFAAREQDARGLAHELGRPEHRLHGARDARDARLGRVVPGDRAHVVRARKDAPQLFARVG